MQTILPEDTAVRLSLPLGRIGLIIAVALLAGALASLLPARRATKVAPVDGLVTV